MGRVGLGRSGPARDIMKPSWRRSTVPDQTLPVITRRPLAPPEDRELAVKRHGATNHRVNEFEYYIVGRPHRSARISSEGCYKRRCYWRRAYSIM